MKILYKISNQYYLMICFGYDPPTPKWGLKDVVSNIYFYVKSFLLSTLKAPSVNGLGDKEG